MAAGLGAAALALYLKTASPTFVGLDAAELAIAAYTLGIPHATGYPLFVLLGWLFTHAMPAGEVVFRTTAMTALFAALSVATVFLILRQLRLRRAPATLACALFAASYYQWSSATATKEHSLHDFLLALTLWLLLKWQRSERFAWLAAATLAFSVSLTNHMSAALYAPALVVFVLARRRVRLRQLAALTLTGLAGLLPYAYLPLTYTSGARFSIAGVYDGQGNFHRANLASVEGMWWMITGRQFGRLFLSVPPDLLPGNLLDVASWLWTSFFGLGVVLGLFGLGAFLRRNPWFFGLAASLALAHALFFATYAVPDREAMFVPVYLAWTLPLGCGIAALLAALRRGVWRRVAMLALAAWTLAGAAWNYPLVDRSTDHQPRIWASDFLDALPAGSLVFGRWQTAGPLQYLILIDGVRPDVQVIDRFLISGPSMATLISTELGRRPVAVDSEDLLQVAGVENSVSRTPLLPTDRARLSARDPGLYPGLLLGRQASPG